MRLYRRWRGVWCLDIRRDGRRYRLSLKTHDRGRARLEAARIIRDLDSGRLPGDRDRIQLGPLAERYRRELDRRGRSTPYVHRVEKDLRHVLKAGDLAPDAIAERLADFTGARRQNLARAAVSGFCSWLLANGYIVTNPVKAIPRVRELRDRVRRALSSEEVIRLVAEVPESRGFVYAAAAWTGLRWRELRALRWRDLDIDKGTFRVPAGVGKSRELAVLPLMREAVFIFRALWAARRPADGYFPEIRDTALDERLFRVLPTSRTFRRDLARAGISFETAEGVADRHALRVTFISELARRRVPIHVAMRVARLKSARLLAEVYTRLGTEDLADIINGNGHGVPLGLAKAFGMGEVGHHW